MMLQGMRKLSRSWVAGILVALLVVAFAIFGINDVFRGPGGGALAKGRDGVEVGAAQFERELDRRLERMRAEGQTVTREDVRNAGQHLALLEELVSQQSIDRLARVLGLSVSTESVAEQLRTLPAFQNQITNAFDRDQYLRLLAENGYSEAEFEDQLRKEMVRGQLLSAALAGLRPPESYGRFALAYRGERRALALLEIPADRAGRIADPTDAELTTFYDEVKARRFATPERRSLTIVVAAPETFSAKVDVPEEEILKLWEFRKRSLGSPERRTFVQVVAPNEAAAGEAARRLAAGEEPEAVAQAIGGDALPFNDVAREAAPDAKVADAVFRLNVGQTTGAVLGSLRTWSVSRLIGVTPAVVPDLGDHRDALRAEIAAEEADGLLNEAVERFEDLRAGGKPLEEAAAEAGLAVVRAAEIDAQGQTPPGRPSASEATAQDPTLLKAAFALAEAESSDFLTLANGAFALAQVDVITPAGVLPLEEVRAPLLQDWRARARMQALMKIAEAVKTEVEAGAALEGVARSRGLRVIAANELVDRRITQAGPQAGLGRAVFAAKEGEVVISPAPGPEPVLLVAHVKAITRFDPDSAPELVDRAREGEREALADDHFESLRAGAVAAARVVRDDAQLAQIMGVVAEDEAADAAGS